MIQWLCVSDCRNWHKKSEASAEIATSSYKHSALCLSGANCCQEDHSHRCPPRDSLKLAYDCARVLHSVTNRCGNHQTCTNQQQNKTKTKREWLADSGMSRRTAFSLGRICQSIKICQSRSRKARSVLGKGSKRISITNTIKKHHQFKIEFSADATEFHKHP